MLYKKDKKYFPKISIPIMNETIEAINTAPAAISFIRPAFSFCCGLTKSTIPSMAEFIISSDITNPIQIKSMHQSVEFTFKNTAAKIVRIAEVKIIFILRCLRLCEMPLKAYEKDLKNDFTSDFFFGVKIN